MLGWFAVSLTADRREVWDALRVLTGDAELIDAYARQIAGGGTDWDFAEVQMWIAYLRTGELIVRRDDR